MKGIVYVDYLSSILLSLILIMVAEHIMEKRRQGKDRFYW